MALSVFDIFKVGIGPSSSHTVGPMIAALRFVNRLEQADLLESAQRLHIEMFGSLARPARGIKVIWQLLLGCMVTSQRRWIRTWYRH